MRLGYRQRSSNRPHRGLPMQTFLRISCLICVSFGVVARAAQSPSTVASRLADNDAAKVQARYDNGKELARLGQHAAALNEFLWCYDEGMTKVARFVGVRGSFLLSDIGRLANVFPPAREALVERRDAAEQRALSDPKDSRAVADFASLCDALKDDVRLVKLFDALPKDDRRRRAFGLSLFRIFVQERRYADALVVFPFTQMVSLWNATVKRGPASLSAAANESRIRHAITTALNNIEVLVGAGQFSQAREMIDLLVDLDASRETQRLLDERLKRAGQPDLLRPPEGK
jgi:hypothetical protein